MSNDTVTYTISTKATKDSQDQTTKLTLDWEGATVEDLRAIATSAIVIKFQAWARKNGIPAAKTIKASDYVPGRRVSRTETVEEMFAGLSPAERLALFAKYPNGLQSIQTGDEEGSEESEIA